MSDARHPDARHSDEAPDLESSLKALAGSGHRREDRPEHPDDITLAQWLEGGGDPEVRRRVESHLAECAECRALAADVAESLEESAEQHAPAEPIAERPGRLIGFPIGPTVVRIGALAAVLALAVVSFRLWKVDGGLATHGVGFWDRLTADRSLLADTSHVLNGELGRIGPDLNFPPFDPGQAVSRGATAVATPLSPRWEAVPRDPVFTWRSDQEPEELLVIDEQERVVLMVTLDPSDLTESDGIYSYSPSAGMELDRGLLYAWKVNVRDSRGELGASELVPFRLAEYVGRRCLDDRGSALLAATDCLRMGFLSRAELRLHHLPDSEEKRRWLSELKRLRHLPQDDNGSGGPNAGGS